MESMAGMTAKAARNSMVPIKLLLIMEGGSGWGWGIADETWEDTIVIRYSCIREVVGGTGFEPATTRPPAVCSTRLSYPPIRGKIFHSGLALPLRPIQRDAARTIRRLVGRNKRCCRENSRRFSGRKQVSLSALERADRPGYFGDD